MQLERQSSEESFWLNSQVAGQKMKRLTMLKDDVVTLDNLQKQSGSILEFYDLAIQEDDQSLIIDLDSELQTLKDKVNQIEFTAMFSGQYDRRNALLAVHAGSGGVEAQDWASILLRMYIRWADQKNLVNKVMDVSPGEEAGIKSAVLQITGDFSYGYMRSERGVHRLVRMSPFDADHARHTSFALVEVMPEVEMGADIELDQKDVRIDVFRAGGHGGQSVQKNSTAVRMTHIPTGIKAICQNERSLHQNKEIATKILLARLMEREMKIQAEERSKIKGDHVSAEWGNQIRSYVLHPYQMVKDHRTNFEMSDSNKVLDGEINGFINSYLQTGLD